MKRPFCFWCKSAAFAAFVFERFWCVSSATRAQLTAGRPETRSGCVLPKGAREFLCFRNQYETSETAIRLLLRFARSWTHRQATKLAIGNTTLAICSVCLFEYAINGYSIHILGIQYAITIHEMRVRDRNMRYRIEK